MVDRSDQGAALICNTDNINTACCRSIDNNGNGPIGDWFYPNNSQVISNQNNNINDTFVRIGFTKEVRLVKIGSPTGPLGLYRCEVSDRDNGVSTASIYITLKGKLTKYNKTNNCKIYRPKL